MSWFSMNLLYELGKSIWVWIYSVGLKCITINLYSAMVVVYVMTKSVSVVSWAEATTSLESLILVSWPTAECPNLKAHQSLQGLSHHFSTLWINMSFSRAPSHQEDMPIPAGWHIAGSEADTQELCLKHILLLFYIKPLRVRKKKST